MAGSLTAISARCLGRAKEELQTAELLQRNANSDPPSTAPITRFFMRSEPSMYWMALTAANTAGVCQTWRV